MIAVDIHLHRVCSLDCSFKSITSIVVRHSRQLGVAVFVTKSYKDLQSVIIIAKGSSFNDTSGLCQRKSGSLMKPHMQRTHVSLSNDDDIAYASALSVDLTTLPICFVCHTMGEKSVTSFCESFLVQVIMKMPCCADSCLADAKLASPKLAKQISEMGIGRTMTAVLANCCASFKTLFPSRRVLTLADPIPFCKPATLAAMSGRECTAAYCKLPHKALS